MGDEGGRDKRPSSLDPAITCTALDRYGEEFQYSAEAVSVRSGGIVPKKTIPFAADAARLEVGPGGAGFVELSLFKQPATQRFPFPLRWTHRFAAAARLMRSRDSGGSSEDEAPWNERLCVDCPLSGEDVTGGEPARECGRSVH